MLQGARKATNPGEVAVAKILEAEEVPKTEQGSFWVFKGNLYGYLVYRKMESRENASLCASEGNGDRKAEKNFSGESDGIPIEGGALKQASTYLLLARQLTLAEL